MAALYVMIGCPGSGKSTWVANHYDRNEDSWFSRDKIRFSIVSEEEDYFSKEKIVFEEFVREINEGLENGDDVFADATHISKASRKKLLKAVNLELVSEIKAIWIKTPLSECIKRNENRVGTRSYVPQGVIKRMYNNFEEPEFEEGFNTIYVIEEHKPIQIIKERA